MSESILSAVVQESATNTILDIDLNVQAEKGPDLRKDYSKSHSLVWGNFNVENEIPEGLKAGWRSDTINRSVTERQFCKI